MSEPRHAERRDPDEPARWFRSYSASSVGIEIVVAVLIGVGGGVWLEKNVTHWSPWTTLLGLVVGMGAAVKAVIRTINEVNRQAERDRAREAAQLDREAANDAGAGGEIPTTQPLEGGPDARRA